MSFGGKVVIVTGSSSGIGAATAIQFAKEGADVIITGRNDAKLKNVHDECAKHGKPPLVVKADISDEAQSKSIIDRTIEKFGKIDVLINNAGYTEFGSVLGGNLMKAYDGLMGTNLRPVFYLTMLAAPHLIKTKGNIVNVSSICGVTIVSDPFIPYSVSKAALDHFTRGSAFELSRHGVRVNSVSPGPARTCVFDNVNLNKTWEDMGKMSLLQIVLEPVEVADLILYLSSDKAKGITGGIYTIDNGCVLDAFTKFRD